MFIGLLYTQNFKRDCDVHDSFNSERLTADYHRQNDVRSEDFAAIFREQFGYVCANDVGM